MITLSASIRDQSSKKIVGPITEGLPIKSLPPKRSIEITVSGGKVGCVSMTLNGKGSVERIAPYVFGGDDGLLDLPPGDYLLGVSAFTDKDAKTPPVATLKLHFSVASPAPSVPIIKGIVSGVSKIPQYDPFLKACGVTHIRSWEDIDWDVLPVVKDADNHKTAKDLGYKICTVFTTNQKPRKEQQVIDWFTRAANIYNGLVDIWELGNEPNWGNYKMGTLEDYFKLYLVPASKVLRDRKLIVCGGSPTTNVSDFSHLVSYGYLDCCDYAAFHPYGANAQEHVQRIKEVNALCNGKPLLLTEWNIHAKDAQGNANPKKWESNIGTCWAAVKAYTAGAFYYRSEANDQPAGRQGILTKGTLLPNEPYYSVFKAMQ